SPCFETSWVSKKPNVLLCMPSLVFRPPPHPPSHNVPCECAALPALSRLSFSPPTPSTAWPLSCAQWQARWGGCTRRWQRRVAAQGNAGKKREMDANSKKLGLLLQRLNQRDVSPSVAGKLGPLCAALDAGDYATALHIQVDLTTKDWEECGVWLTALKSVIKTRQQLG
ncbi:unnamed protein product, partial [Closterium sp. NIES-64]